MSDSIPTSIWRERLLEYLAGARIVHDRISIHRSVVDGAAHEILNLQLKVASLERENEGLRARLIKQNPQRAPEKTLADFHAELRNSRSI